MSFALRVIIVIQGVPIKKGTKHQCYECFVPIFIGTPCLMYYMYYSEMTYMTNSSIVILCVNGYYIKWSVIISIIQILPITLSQCNKNSIRSWEISGLTHNFTIAMKHPLCDICVILIEWVHVHIYVYIVFNFQIIK